MGVKLSDALKFSWGRKALHPTDDGFPVEATDFGVTSLVPTKGFFRFVTETKSWTDLDPDLRRELLKSAQWEPADPKPAMLVLAEAYALDWGDPEIENEDDQRPDDEDDC